MCAHRKTYKKPFEFSVIVAIVTVNAETIAPGAPRLAVSYKKRERKYDPKNKTRKTLNHFLWFIKREKKKSIQLAIVLMWIRQQCACA